MCVYVCVCIFIPTPMVPCSRSADQLQSELQSLGVEVDDKTREWYMYKYICICIYIYIASNLSPNYPDSFCSADQLQSELQSLGVEVDDKTREWYMRYAPTGGRVASSFNVRPQDRRSGGGKTTKEDE